MPFKAIHHRLSMVVRDVRGRCTRDAGACRHGVATGAVQRVDIDPGWHTVAARNVRRLHSTAVAERQRRVGGWLDRLGCGALSPGSGATRPMPDQGRLEHGLRAALSQRSLCRRLHCRTSTVWTRRRRRRPNRSAGLDGPAPPAAHRRARFCRRFGLAGNWCRGSGNPDFTVCQQLRRCDGYERRVHHCQNASGHRHPALCLLAARG